MAIHNPPRYRYSLFDPWDTKALTTIRQIAETKKYPKIIATHPEEIDAYLTMLIRTQKSLHDWRDFLKDTLAEIDEKGTITIQPLLLKYPPESIGTDAPEWVTYEEDKIVNNFIDELGIKKIHFSGTNEEISKFILRFIIGQLGHDWEWTIMMVWEMLGNGNTLSVPELNEELKNFDYLKIFTQ